jgi:hypothetical protein
MGRVGDWGIKGAAGNLLLSPGNFDAEIANGNGVEIYPVKKEGGGESG